MNLYTFIMDYKGGTYISQTEAADEQEAMIRWIENLETSRLKASQNVIKEKLLNLDFLVMIKQPKLQECKMYGILMSAPKRNLLVSIS